MIIYLDLLFFLNFIFDFIILLLVNIVLKRNVSWKRLLLSSLFGEISILFLIFNYNYLILFVSKILLAIIINIIAFKYNNFKYLIINISYFYMISIIIGGFIYYLKINNISYFWIFILLPILLIIYLIQIKILKVKQNHFYEISITFNNNHKINLVGYLDTGNTLIDPISKKAIIIVDKKIIDKEINLKRFIYVPIKMVNNKDLLKCISIKYLEIEGRKIDKVLVGLSNDSLNIDGANCLLNERLMGR